jgi:hypothetical protein
VGREINNDKRNNGGQHNRSVIETHENNLEGGAKDERMVTEHHEDSLASAAPVAESSVNQ